MKTKNSIIAAISILAFTVTVFITSCEEETTGPETVPIKAEIKQVKVLNSIHTVVFHDAVPEDIDTVEISIPYGTDVTSLDLDIIVSYFGTIEPAAGITDLTNPITYSVTSNHETRDVLVMATQVPPSLTSFLLISPFEQAGRIVKDTTGTAQDTIKLKIKEGVDLSNAKFAVEFFGESVVPDPLGTIDLEVENPTLAVVNKEFQTTYVIDVERYKEILFTGFIYDGTDHPNAFLPGAMNSEDSTDITIVEDENALGGKAAQFTSLVEGAKGKSINFEFAEIIEHSVSPEGLSEQPEAITVIMRGKGVPVTAYEDSYRYVEMNVYMGFWRFQFWVEWDGLDGTDYSQLAYEDVPAGLDPLEWNIYRLTANSITGEVKIYLNEDPEPLEPMMPLYLGIRDSENWKVYFGDGSGGNAYDGIYDYYIIETGGAYSPTDLPLSKILGEEEE